MNILSFDIEEWYLTSKTNPMRESIVAEYDKMLEEILNLLEQKRCKATFFCVGKMGIENPDVVRKIHSLGHEIGCHSNMHKWLNKMNYEECLEDTRIAIDSLEQCIGEKIESYRAPAFSIGLQNLWAFDVLSKCGIIRDSSVYPSERDFGGFPNFGSLTPTTVQYNGIQIKEFPIAMTSIIGRKMAFSGGGYFRFFPYFYIHQKLQKNDYGICYLHLEDLRADKLGFMSRKNYENYFKEKGTLYARTKRYIKSNVGKKGAWEKMRKIIKTIDFTSLKQADIATDWDKAPMIDYSN